MDNNNNIFKTAAIVQGLRCIFYILFFPILVIFAAAGIGKSGKRRR